MKKLPMWVIEKIDDENSKKTRTLDLSGYGKSGAIQLKEFPEEIINLDWLEELDLSNNNLTVIPESIFRLNNLRYLNLSQNYLTKLPGSIGRLSNLQYLGLGSNELIQLPETISQLKNLTELHLSGNINLVFPSSISLLQNLKIIYLNKMGLENIPDAIVYLPHLEELALNENRIKEIIPQLFTLSSLRVLRLADNPIEVPPPEITYMKRYYGRDDELADVEKIQRYFRQLEAKGKDFLYEAKLLVVGEGGAGKTTLAKKLENPDYQLRDEKSTEGISVIKWQFPIENGKMFRVNIWDFGGQEIYHATHQFFLTKRSLYALIADTRKEDTDFYYWLNVIELLSDSSPIIIVKNEKQDRRRELNEKQLRGQFNDLRETVAANLATNRGLPNVIDEIKHYVTHLPHVGSVLPKTWVRVREALEKYPGNYISFDEYLRICEKNGFSELGDKLLLSSYLHDLGVCLHFQEDPVLRKIIILKPEWGTYAVYKVLDNPKVIQSFGHFTSADLSHIWDSPEYLNVHDELLQLMMRFRLCYRIPTKSDIYIAPQLLTENQPSYEWDEKDNLLLRYVYEFMPKGILSQLIVSIHHLILEQSHMWKSGVVIEKESTRAEVVEHYGKREIKIRVAGKHKKDLMSIVMYELDKIHSTYKRLKYDKLIPCNCQYCRDNQDPHFYPFEVLRKFTEDKQDHIQCLKSYKNVVVWDLLDDVVARSMVTNSESDKTNPRTSYEIKVGDGADVGAIIVGSSVEHSFVEKSEQINEVIKHLSDALSRMSMYMPKEGVQETAHDFDVLKEESAKKYPDPKRCRVSAEGLAKAARNLGSIGQPVIELVAKLVSLMLIRT